MSDESSEEKVIQDILFILDESGSMSSMGIEPVQAVNKFIDDLLDSRSELTKC